MPAPTPEFIPEAFAVSAAGIYRNTIPAAPVTTQRASFELGFPPLTMTPEVAGGKPMLGPDLNGVLYMMSSHTVYAQSGQPYRYSAAVATAIGGYATGTLLGSTDGVTLWLNQVAANSTDPDAGGAGWYALTSYGVASITGLAGGVRVLTYAEYAKKFIVLSGALVGNQQIIFPTLLEDWLIINLCTGAFTVTAKTAGPGAGVTIPAGGYASPTEVYGNGTDINPTFAPAALPIDVNPTPSTIPLRTNTGLVLGATAATNDNSQTLATTACVDAKIQASVTSSNGLKGHIHLPGGKIFQWGTHTFGNLLAGAYANSVIETFDIPFPNQLENIVFGKTGDAAVAVAGGRNFTLSQFELYMEEWQNFTQGPDCSATYFATGF